MLTNDELIQRLQKLADPDPSERRTAAEALAAGDERAVYPLIRALHDDNAGVQDAAMRSIIAIGGEATAYMALPLLRESPFLRNTARIILRQIGPPAVPLLRPLLSDKDDDVRTFAVDLISDIGSCGFPADIAGLLRGDPNQNVRSSAARALGALGYRDGVPALVAALRDNEWVAFSAVESLALIRDESSVDALLELAVGPSDALRCVAVEALGGIGSSRATPVLMNRLPFAGDMEKTAIAKSLVRIGVTPAMTEISDLLIALFSSGDWEERLIALSGLADLQDSRAIPAILDTAGALDPSDPESEERLLAVRQALARFGCAPALTSVLSDPAVKFRGKVIAVEVTAELGCREAVPALIGLLQGDLREVRRAAIQALAAIGGDEALQELRVRITDRDGHVRSAALAALGGCRDRESFDAVLARLDVENYPDVLEEAVRTLLRIDAAALFGRRGMLTPAVRELVARSTDDVEMLLSLSRDGDQAVQLAALAGLGRTGDARARSRLSEALRDAAPETRKTAVAALGALNCAPADLRGALRDEDPWVRLSAVRVVGDSDAPEAAQEIVPLLSDRAAPVVLAAVDALVRLGRTDVPELNALRNHPDEGVRERAAMIRE